MGAVPPAERIDWRLHLGLHPVALRVRFSRLRKRLEENGVPTDEL